MTAEFFMSIQKLIYATIYLFTLFPAGSFLLIVSAKIWNGVSLGEEDVVMAAMAAIFATIGWRIYLSRSRAGDRN